MISYEIDAAPKGAPARWKRGKFERANGTFGEYFAVVYGKEELITFTVYEERHAELLCRLAHLAEMAEKAEDLAEYGLFPPDSPVARAAQAWLDEFYAIKGSSDGDPAS